MYVRKQLCLDANDKDRRRMLKNMEMPFFWATWDDEGDEVDKKVCPLLWPELVSLVLVTGHSSLEIHTADTGVVASPHYAACQGHH